MTLTLSERWLKLKLFYRRMRLINLIFFSFDLFTSIIYCLNSFPNSLFGPKLNQQKRRNHAFNDRTEQSKRVKKLTITTRMRIKSCSSHSKHALRCTFLTTDAQKGLNPTHAQKTTHAQKGLHYACAEWPALRMRRKSLEKALLRMRRKSCTTHAQKGLHNACVERAALRTRRKDCTTHAQKRLHYACAERAALRMRRKVCTTQAQKGLHYACA